MGRKAAQYDPVVLTRIRASWEAFKDRTGLPQVKAAELLGMNQSAFSQYLRGSVPLNTNFIAKFAKLVDEKPSYFDDSLSEINFTGEDYPSPVTVPVDYTLSGKKYDPPKMITLSGNYSTKNRILVEVDSPFFNYKEGVLLVVELTPQNLRETTEVILFDSEKNVKNAGELVSVDGGKIWAVKTIVEGQIHTIPKREGDYLFRILGCYYQEPTYKKILDNRNQKPW